ncbi:MAG: hypothetical protein DKM50_00550 [Candidatus Margulisiibacteriota bacterium]|nr:MAG: hypothetical protein DKM50_00550 [Candidatus Margulisiibacteriota bacterium]HAR64342.1 hypothetical protein [Candidatus Margulisiibacteriota bacterium]
MKEKVIIARQKASLAVNSVLMELYWDLDKKIAEKENNTKWGSGFI